ncbi:hypothetical protein Gotri_002449 [Gossypium trilobum]|uniref:Uncharacterized protein n=1 Tax=Gossypium trilobum TaxID=34281 RepID=A0A7J9F8M2_9ROSI|nr:hypothetical protein [Gossypium trilobum]
MSGPIRCYYFDHCCCILGDIRPTFLQVP